MLNRGLSPHSERAEEVMIKSRNLCDPRSQDNLHTATAQTVLKKSFSSERLLVLYTSVLSDLVYNETIKAG